MFVRVSLSNIQFSKKFLMFTVIFAALTQGWFCTLSSIFLMKPESIAKRNVKINWKKKQHLSVFLPKKQQNRKKSLIDITIMIFKSSLKTLEIY